ncbi:SAM-dependent methyltransferase [Nocardia donostiensis]|uniref:class I SAM-dependent DNA methyltransferase n=1 Tax=Nocardia donostiensis TaxID=1538463 RepID=UPI0009DB2485|nr:class I SAM-dependent methyltransferase [Nocardia donostiensis]OQS13002.1 SAM-dependent methyltransferase [Nocardia donostiensis]
MPTFADFDRRHYRIVDVATGYDGWAPSYDETVLDEMDLALLDRLRYPEWGRLGRVADLGCGTGRTAAWLREHGVTLIDGVDLSEGMLEHARSRGAHTTVGRADVRDTGLPAATYDLVIASLIDEHLPDLTPFYAEAGRLAAPGATLVTVSYHPQFMMVSGMPTHYTSESGEPLTIRTHLHLFSDHVAAAAASGWRLAEAAEALVGEAWIAAKPSWAALRGHPFTLAQVWTQFPGPSGATGSR